MKVSELDLPGILLIEPDVFADERGFFLESYSRQRYVDAGLEVHFVQDNHSRSQRNVIRGLHYQLSPGQAKLVSVSHGRIRDVVVDLRRGSPFFGQWLALELSGENQRQLYIPAGFAHGFSVLSDVADVTYKVDQYYNGARERGILWDDADLAIDWQVVDPILSDKDRMHPNLADAEIDFRWG